MRFCLKKTLFIVLLSLAALFASAQQTADGDSVLQLLRNQLNSNFLELSKSEHPAYFMAYRIHETEKHCLSSDFGSLIENVHSKEVVFSVEIRIGNPDLDNHHTNNNVLEIKQKVKLPLEYNSEYIIDVIKTETAHAWNEAVARYSHLLSESHFLNFESYSFDGSGYDNYFEPKSTFFFDEESWIEKTKFYSSDISQYLTKAEATLYYENSRNYYVNTENTYIVENQNNTYLDLNIEGLSKDKTIQKLQYRYFSLIPSQLPDEQTVNIKFKELENRLFNVLDAEQASFTICPVILSPKAASILMHNTIGHAAENQEDTPFLLHPYNKICNEQFSISCNPNIQTLNNENLSGHYKYDNEGIRGENVVIVKQGYVDKLLASRTQNINAPHTNGHARDVYSRFIVGQSNLFTKSDKPLSHNKLIARLKENLRSNNLEYGLYVKDAEIVCERNNIVKINPSECYKVFADNREDVLVRNLELWNTAQDWLKNIVYAGDSVCGIAILCKHDEHLIPTHSCSPELLISDANVEQKKTFANFVTQTFPPQFADEAFDNTADLFFKTAEIEHTENLKNIDPDLSAPYLSEFLMTDARFYSISASAGNIISSNEKNVRKVFPKLYLGSDLFNNDNFFDGEETDASSYPMPLDDDEISFRRFLSKAVDEEYRKAHKQWLSKQSLHINSRNNKLHDRSSIDKPNPRNDYYWKYPSLQDFQALAAEFSNSLAKIPNANSSVAKIFVCLGNAYFWGSDKVSYTQPVATICLQLQTELKVGKKENKRYIKNFFFDNVESLYSDTAKNRIDCFVEQLCDKSDGISFSENYFGPVLVEGEAVGKLLSMALLTGNDNIFAQREPLFANDEARNKFNFNNLENNIEKIVTSRDISVSVNKDQKDKVDAEGAPIEEVEVINKGELYFLVSDRIPTKNSEFSKGGMQIGIAGGAFVPQKGVKSLNFEHKKTLSETNVKSNFLKLAKKNGLKVAYIIKDVLEDDDSQIIDKLILYQIDLHNGKETAVYGANLQNFDFWSLKNVIAVSNTTQVQNILVPFCGKTDFPINGVLTKINSYKYLLLNNCVINTKTR